MSVLWRAVDVNTNSARPIWCARRPRARAARSAIASSLSDASRSIDSRMLAIRSRACSAAAAVSWVEDIAHVCDRRSLRAIVAMSTSAAPAMSSADAMFGASAAERSVALTLSVRKFENCGCSGRAGIWRNMVRPPETG
uniref:Uncharacterized protein n=1 Tax=Burkholderia cenocepacia TaxID=95486 RepID=A0A071MU13_9BURK